MADGEGDPLLAERRTEHDREDCKEHRGHRTGARRRTACAGTFASRRKPIRAKRRGEKTGRQVTGKMAQVLVRLRKDAHPFTDGGRS